MPDKISTAAVDPPRVAINTTFGCSFLVIGGTAYPLAYRSYAPTRSYTAK